MRQNQIKEIAARLDSYNYENLFTVHNTDDGGYRYNLLNSLSIPQNLDPSVYTLYKVPSDNTFWTFISYKNYGTVKLWWLILVVNGINNPVKFPKAGQVLKILKPELIQEVILDMTSDEN